MNRDLVASLFMVIGVCFFTFFNLISYAHAKKISPTPTPNKVCLTATPLLTATLTPIASISAVQPDFSISATVTPVPQNGSTASTGTSTTQSTTTPSPTAVLETPIPCTRNTCGWK